MKSSIHGNRIMKSIEAFTREAIGSDSSWIPSEAGSDTAEQYVEAYLSAPDAWWWSTNDYSSDEIEVVLKRTLAIVAQAKLPAHENALGQLGVGPLENMMSDDLLDILVHWQPFPPRCAMRSHAFAWKFNQLQYRNV